MRWLQGTPGESSTCPRRTVLRSPDAIEALSVWLTSGEHGIGIGGLARLSGQGVSALAIVGQAVCWRRMQEAKQGRG